MYLSLLANKIQLSETTQKLLTTIGEFEIIERESLNLEVSINDRTGNCLQMIERESVYIEVSMNDRTGKCLP